MPDRITGSLSGNCATRARLAAPGLHGLSQRGDHEGGGAHDCYEHDYTRKQSRRDSCAIRKAAAPSERVLLSHNTVTRYPIPAPTRMDEGMAPTIANVVTTESGKR